MGLAWSPLGGGPCYIESVGIPLSYGSGSNSGSGSDSDSDTTKVPISSSAGSNGISIVTGQLGSVMKESVQIASTFTRRFLHQHLPQNNFFASNIIHLHVPEGVVEKDGPSAGVAMTCSLLSLASGVPVAVGVAMTGELSLTGKVLPVGGIKEKTLGKCSVVYRNNDDIDNDDTYCN